MVRQSVIERQLNQSPLKAQSPLNPEGGRRRRNLVSTLILTSLVDVFSILVIYLLMNTSASTEQLELQKDIQLPQAEQSHLLEPGLAVRVDKGHYFIKDEKVQLENLNERLAQVHEQLKEDDSERAKKMIIQADKTIPFHLLNPLVLAASQNGFEKISFAVLEAEVSQ